MLRSLAALSAVVLAVAMPAQWNQANPNASPSGRIEPAMAFDAGSANTVLFGGADVGGFPPTNFSDTWTWDGSDWSQKSPASMPGGRYFAGMAHDLVRARTVLYGGLTATFFGGNYNDDTWEWDGSSWSQVTTANTPGSLIGNAGVAEHSMAYDAIGQRIVMFGGELFQGIVPAPNVTLLYDGTDWTQASPATAPPRRSQAAMCGAPTLGGVLLFGGTNFNNPPGPGGEILWNDLWSYSASTDSWTQLAPSGALPAPRAGASLLFDPVNAVYVLHGGYVADPMNPGFTIPDSETWQFDGSSWTNVSSAAGNPTGPRVRFAMANGPNGCPILFGGSSAFFGANYSDSWNYGYCAAAVAFGVGCTGSGGVPVLSAANRPVLGATYQLDVASLVPSAIVAFMATGFSNTTSLLGPLPLNLSVVGLDPSCLLLVSADTTGLFGVAGGAGAWTVALPGDPSFNGVDLHHQVGSLDALVPGGFSVSNGVSSRLGSN